MLYNENNLAVAKMAAKSDFRPELASVLFTKEKTVATDSFRLLEVTVPKNVKVEDYPKVAGNSAMRGFSPFMVNAKSLAGIKVPKSQSLPVLQNVAVKHVSPVFTELMTTDGQSADVKRFPKVDGVFPNYEQIFPQGEPVMEITVNPELLGELLMTVAKMVRKGTSEVTMKFYGKEKPVMVEAGTDSQKIRGLVMPIRK